MKYIFGTQNISGVWHQTAQTAHGFHWYHWFAVKLFVDRLPENPLFCGFGAAYVRNFRNFHDSKSDTHTFMEICCI